MTSSLFPPEISFSDKKVLFNDISDEWKDILENKYLDSDVIPELKALTRTRRAQVTPPAPLVFSFAKYCNLDQIKVVIIGQDPYPTKGYAHGLAFSCLGTVPKSLLNIYKCLIKQGIITYLPKHGNLSYWAEQGVLLLNTALTTVIGKPKAHERMWKKYTNTLIKDIADQLHPIFILWGRPAQSKAKFINDECKVLSWVHPSPLNGNKFLTCDNFKKTNKFLLENKETPIDWNIDKPVDNIDKRFNLDNQSVKTTVVFTDGSCYPNRSCPEAEAGYATAFALGEFVDTVMYGNIEKKVQYATSQRAEGTAIYKAMEFLRDHITEWDRCVIVSDSEFWIKMFEQYMLMWTNRAIDFEEKKNSDMTIPMWQLYCELTGTYSKSIEFRHMTSHNKDGWKNKREGSYEHFCYHNNDYVDRMASYARVNKKPGEHVITSAEYS